MKKAKKFWKNFWMVKSFQHERRKVEKLKNVSETRKGGKRHNIKNGGFRNGG